MRIKYIVEFLFTVLLLGLTLLALFAKSPEETRFEDVIEQLLHYEHVSSVEELRAIYPQLGLVESNLNRMGYLYRDINSLTAGPAPNPSASQHLELIKNQEEIRLLKSEVELQLQELLAMAASK